ncbi:MAG TPA: hypothetical protein VGL71_01520, partial [Urbifossiella sp.]
VCKPVLEAGPIAEAPLCDRRHVYAFMIHGVTPSGSDGLDGLRLKLAERGYEKTYLGDLFSAWWFAFEMKSILKCDPTARFVVIGDDLGCGAAVTLGRFAERQKWPIDAVVLLDPVSLKEACSCKSRTIVIRSGATSIENLDAECVCVSNCGHWTLPTNPKTVEAIAEVMKSSAMKVEHPDYWEGMPFEYEDAPPRVMPNAIPGSGEGWFFLHDQFGTHTRPLTPLPRWSEPGAYGPLQGIPLMPVPNQGTPLPLPRKLEGAP